MTEEESIAREQIVLVGKSLFDRGFGVGSSGNISVRIDDGVVITPTNTSLGRLDPARLAKIAFAFWRQAVEGGVSSPRGL